MFGSFQLIKAKLVSALIMVTPTSNEPFEIMCDDSDYTGGAVLLLLMLKKKLNYYGERDVSNSFCL